MIIYIIRFILRRPSFTCALSKVNGQVIAPCWRNHCYVDEGAAMLNLWGKRFLSSFDSFFLHEIFSFRENQNDAVIH